MSDRKRAIAEILGGAALLAALFGYVLLMGAEIISGAGLFLMLISLGGYCALTALSRNRSSPRAYWALYAAKIVFLAALLALSPLISRVLALLING